MVWFNFQKHNLIKMIILKNSSVLCKNYKEILRKWTYRSLMRSKSSAEPKTKTYSHTILFPKTNFPTRSSNAMKEEIQKSSQFAELYNWQRENLKGPEYVLQDGPPYANGDLHMGHAVNKIIKDINNRSQVLQGNKVHFIPGWDCHGLPIELKALQKAKKKSKSKELTDPVSIRQTARNFALETVERQKDVFKSWGVMADWDSCYLTLSKSYVKNQLQQFHKMFEKGLIFRALKPVYWSPSTKTALAEAELEYDPQHKSTQVYVSFPIETPPKILQDKLNGQPLFALIWTTTPWTLIANKAICYNPAFKYSCVTIDKQHGLYLMASELVQELETTLGVKIRTVLEFDGKDLLGTTYTSSLPLGSSRPLLPASHVTCARGSGLVHTAPAHGPDDFKVGIEHNISVECHVDEAGCYTNVSPELDGLPVLSTGQDAVISLLGERVLYRDIYVHSYPLDWRSKQPVILRASDQWFIDTAAIKERALAALEQVEILPPSSSEQSRQGFKAQVEKRPYWCISRQRAWGVPIPAVYHGEKVIVDKRITDHLCELIEKHGTDVWWTSDVKQLVPRDVIEDLNLDVKNVTKGRDILDIWFDSGLAWSNTKKQAQLYCEGLDQLTGWFQASLLTSVALTGQPPYRSIFVHGFVVDEKKRKMSKSIGNVIDPTTIVHGGRDKNQQPAYGIDTLRWWVASHSTQHSQIVVSKKLLDDCQAEVIRIRNILKYLLGVISDLEKQDFDKKPSLNAFDQYLVHETQEFLQQINEYYNTFRYNNVAQNVLYFVSNKVSGLYCHCIKDRLYCSEKDSEVRLAAQLVSHTILVSLCKALGPILPHLIEETWQHHPLKQAPFYFTQNVPILNSKSFDVSIIDAILEIKKDVCSVARNENLRKFSCDINLNPNLFSKLKDLNACDGLNDSVLCEILELSSVNLVEDVSLNTFSVQLSVIKASQCLRCRKYNALENSDKCLRCEKVVTSL